MSHHGPAGELREASEDAGDALAAAALDVLAGNWLGHATRPSADLYPHQWSWDSACVAMGYASVDLERAATELRSLFAGQWRDGLLPHIVFSGEGRYFPGPEVWQTERSADAPPGIRTSGILQPPLHATALLRLVGVAADRCAALSLARELLPGLRAWHAYLHRARTRAGAPLVEIWHPWESGMDNSPSWDAALARVPSEAVPRYTRVDVDVVEREGRPTDADYDRYAYLVKVLREAAYRPDALRPLAPFVVRSVLVNALLVRADHDLAELSELAGEDGEPFRARAGRLAAALDAALFDEEAGTYVDWDVRAGQPLVSASAAGLVPLFAGVPGPARAARLLERLEATAVPVPDGGVAVPSVPPGAPGFEPARYWRGPVWPVLQWLAYHGARRYGAAELAASLRAGLLALVRAQGFREHYHPLTGEGQGGRAFSWTAALVLDLLAHRDGEETT